ncbi:GDP-mannose 4,6-dehydratase [Pseudoxanthomonas sp. F11]|uniref:GDP-mannose 4,6-dehydratase n=1 Tax=Pseudoxanthomonas sp. F11 TaxID=3126308 RepID=UPI00300C3792
MPERLRLLVTGMSGFVGAHVAEAVSRGVFGGNVQLIGTPPLWDVRDSEAVRSWVVDSKPDGVIHLAAQSFVPRSFEAPVETFDINLGGTLNLLQGLSAVGFCGRLLYVSSGDIYGRVPLDEMPVSEIRMPEPRSPYAVSKWAAEQLCLQWHRSEGVDVVVARPFNHVGPGQDHRFAVPSMAAQIIGCLEGRQDAVHVGNIDVTRDFTDVRDVVRAYASLLSRGKGGQTYVVGSGVERSLRSIFKDMCRIAGVDPPLITDPARVRSSEQTRMCADPSRLRADTGWEPIIPFDRTLSEILNDARKKP